MSVQSIPGGLWVPKPYMAHGNSAPAMSFVFAMTVSGAKAAIILQAPKTGSIRKVVWGLRTTTTGATVDVRLETVDATVTPATPTGTLLGTNTNGSEVIANSDDNVIKTTTLTADAAVTQGQLFAVVIANAGSGSMQALSCLGSGDVGAFVQGFPYGISNNGSVWSAAAVTNVYPAISLEYSDGTYVPIPGVSATPLAVTTTAFNTGTTPDVGGLLFQFPFAARVRGAWAYFSGGGDYGVKLVTTAYNQGAGTGVLASATVDKDTRQTTPQLYFFTFDSSVTLSPSTNYRLVIEPSTATSLSLYDVSYASLAQLDSNEGGQQFVFTTAKDPTQNSDWTNYNSGTFRVPFMGLLVDGIDIPTPPIGSAVMVGGGVGRSNYY